jgi:nitrate/nitrite transporter NarK
MGWTILWIAGLVVILLGSIIRSGIILGFVKALFGGLCWTITVGVLVVIGLVFGAFGDALNSGSDDEAPEPEPTVPAIGESYDQNSQP